MISSYEKQYVNLVKKILEEGYYDQNRTGTATKKIPHQVLSVDLQKEFPVLKSKFVASKTATKEMLWIYQHQSNVVEDLRKMNVKVWNEWEGEDGTIGKAYGYQVKKFDQVGKLIEALKNNPQDRRMMINLWNWADLPEMNLAPCCFLTMWDVTDGKLNCMLVQRSGDVGLGVPFNTTQFAVLTHMLAQSCGLDVGILTHVINNAHIYENHFEGMNKLIEQYEKISTIDYVENTYNKNSKKTNSEEVAEKYLKSHGITQEEREKLLPIVECEPKLSLNKEIKDFYSFKPEDISIEDYKYMPSIKMEVSV